MEYHYLPTKKKWSAIGDMVCDCPIYFHPYSLPSEVVQFNKEYTEEDVSDQMKKGSFPLELSNLAPFDFFGLRSDIEAIERGLFGCLGRFFEAAEEMKNGFFSVFGSPNFYDGDSSSSSSPRRGIPIESHPPKKLSPKLNNSESEHVDLSGLSRDV
ncbi:fra a 1-associated protein-like [Actinidia eriantha]|uniref:fra a 1-associated protein-like n=1 Tax=Actinidia eriantha TaxID=165200 RepID=UPI002583661A|nr:fra a 1-associated protein-like [Actinidia eriantha]